MPAPITCAERTLPQPVNEPFIQSDCRANPRRRLAAVARRSRRVCCYPGCCPGGIPGALINHPEHQIDVLFLVDVVSAFVYEFAVDPEWLLTGHYNAATHREALILGEDRTAAGAYVLRQFVRERYEKLRGAGSYPSLTFSKSSK